MLERLARRFHSWDLRRRDPDAVIACQSGCGLRLRRGDALQGRYCSVDCETDAIVNAGP